MFTGIVEEIGRIENIAVNGVCLTATTIGNSIFTADVMPESIKMTTFTNLKVHQPVNLERAMLANGRFGGHIVAGHVDGTGRIINREQTDNAIIFTIEAPKSVMDYVIGTEVNLETDIAGRYIRHFMNLGSEPTEEKPKKSMQSLLVENGFI